MTKTKKQPKEAFIKIPRKALPGIFALFPITAVLISRHDPGPLFLLIMGVGIGGYIGKAMYEK